MKSKTSSTRARATPRVVAAPNAFVALPAARRRQLARDVATMVSAVGTSSARTTTSAGTVNFPSFVGDLLQGVFNAIVNSSVQQMNAYAALVAAVAKNAAQFSQDTPQARAALDRLLANFPQLTDENGDDPWKRRKRRLRTTKTPVVTAYPRLLANVALRATNAPVG